MDTIEEDELPGAGAGAIAISLADVGEAGAVASDDGDASGDWISTADKIKFRAISEFSFLC